MEKLKRSFIISVIFTMVLSMSMMAVPVQVGAAASAGDLIKMSGLSSVYYLGADGKRYVFPNEQTYFSWYSDFSGVVTIPQSELESYPLGANVTIRPGTKLVKITTDPKVYAVEPNGTLKWVPSEAVASALFGANWNQRIIDVPDAFFTNYTVSSVQITSSAYPVGSLIQQPSSADVYYIASDGKARKIASEAAFTANRFMWGDIITTSSSFTLPSLGSEVSGAESDLIDTSSGAGGTPGAGTGLTVSLASDNPAAASILSDGAGTSLDGQALIPVLKLNFMAASDGDVKVTTLRLTRIGISADSDIDNAYLYDGGSILSSLAEMQSISSKILTFSNSSGLFTVAAGTTKTVLVRFDFNRDTTSGKTIGFSLNASADVVTNGASVSGSFPLSGNLMSTATVTDFGGVQVSVVTDNSTAVNPGTANFTAAHFRVTPSNQNLQLQYIKFQMIGSATATDVTNLKLYDGTTQIGTTQQLSSDKTVTFDLTGSPLAISSSQTKNLYIKADVTAGATRTFYFSVQKGADVIVYDTGYGIYLRPHSGTVGSFTTQSSSTVTIGSGSLTVSKTTDSPTGNIADGATNITFAKFSMKATGEAIKVSAISYFCTGTGANEAVEKVKVLVDGSQLGTTDTTITCSGDQSDATTTVNFTVAEGQTRYLTLVGDTTGANIDANDTISFSLNIGSSNGQRQSSLTTLNVPSSSINGNNLTVKTGTVVNAKNTGMGDYSSSNPTGVVGTNNVRIGSFTITAGAGENVDLTMITLRSSGQPLSQDFQNLMIKNQVTGAQIGTTIGTLNSTAAYNYEFSPVTAVRINNGQTLIIDVYADILTNATDTATAFVGVQLYSTSATGVSTSASAGDSTAVTGQNVYLSASGTLIIQAVPASDAVQANIVNASGATANEVELFKFKMTALVEQVDITRFVISDTIAANGYNATTANGTPTTSIYNFKLYDGSTLVAGPVALNSTSTPTNGGYIDFNLGSGNEYMIPAGATKMLTLKGTVNNSLNISSGSGHTFSLNVTPLQDSSTTRAVTAIGHDSSVSKNGPTTGFSGNEITVRKSYPVVTRLSLPTTTLSSGTTNAATVAKFSVTAVGNDIRVKKMTFNITLNDTTTSTALSLSNFKLFRNFSQVANAEYDIYDGTGTAAADELSPGGTAALTTLALQTSGLGAPNTTSTRMVLIFATTSGLAAGGTGSGEEIIGAGSTNTYEIKADIANAHQGATTDSDSVVVTLQGDDDQTQPLTHNLSRLTAATYRFGIVGLNSTNYNFIWSDVSANIGDHTNTIPSTGKDWTHGYEVRSTTATPASYIPLDPWTMAK